MAAWLARLQRLLTEKIGFLAGTPQSPCSSHRAVAATNAARRSCASRSGSRSRCRRPAPVAISPPRAGARRQWPRRTAPPAPAGTAPSSAPSHSLTHDRPPSPCRQGDGLLLERARARASERASGRPLSPQSISTALPQPPSERCACWPPNSYLRTCASLACTSWCARSRSKLTSTGKLTSLSRES